MLGSLWHVRRLVHLSSFLCVHPSRVLFWGTFALLTTTLISAQHLRLSIFAIATGPKAITLCLRHRQVECNATGPPHGAIPDSCSSPMNDCAKLINRNVPKHVDWKRSCTPKNSYPAGLGVRLGRRSSPSESKFICSWYLGGAFCLRCSLQTSNHAFASAVEPN